MEFLPLGQSKSQTTFLNGLVASISSKAGNLREAIRLYNIFIDKDFQISMFNESRADDYVWLPASLLSWEKLELPDEQKTVIITMARYGMPYPKTTIWREIRRDLNKAIKTVLDDKEADPYEELVKIVFKLNPLIAPIK
jgi:maltose-binding protein MalE